MKYLKSALTVVKLIEDANSKMLQQLKNNAADWNFMFIEKQGQNLASLKMDAFSNDFVVKTLGEFQKSDAFAITDLATMDVKGKNITYLLYKGYHAEMDKGIVFYQVIEPETQQPIGKLQFSNMEENIFFSFDLPDAEESSCNAMETDKEIKGGKSIVFFIGHMNEDRLLYDIQRLIMDTIHNVSKHPKLQFSFIISIARYGALPSDKLKKQVQEIATYTHECIVPIYPNTHFEFTFEKDESLN